MQACCISSSRPSARRNVAVVVLVCASLLSPTTDSAEPDSVRPQRASADEVRFFETKIRPLLANHCYECHGELTQESELQLDSLSGILAGGKAGPSIIPGKPSGSLLVTAVSYRDSELQMPPGEKLSDRQIADLTRWVELGAPHPDAESVTSPQQPRSLDLQAAREHWSFRPLVKPTVPTPQDPRWIENPLDAFIASGLEQQGLTPVGRADKRTLIRRATYDLLGLPPTPKEVADFLADDSPDAFASVVDRLLRSPHYGERWGRHWLDIARYADSNGLDENVAHGNAWRYRDYVVDAFNSDKPYDQFLIEQLAGDLLDSGNDWQLRRQRLIATGFLSLGPKVLAEVDEAKMEMDIVDEQLDTVGRSLMGLTLGCARCHDHKFDPISQADYYALAGIFKSTRTMETFQKVARWHENSIASPADLERQEKHERKVAAKNQQIAALVGRAKEMLQLSEDEPEPKNLEARFSKTTQDELKTLRSELEHLKESAPVLPTAMGATEGTVEDVPVHLRGSHLTLGAVVPRRFPQVLAGPDQPSLPADQSGRLQFARWLTSPDHPLTARVMVNRIWRWHFGKGLVPTVDNFGVSGQPPTHPSLLDWLAARLVENGWSIKSMHRLILTSQTYQLSSHFDSQNARIDPENRFYWRFDVRRLEVEAIRDAMLAVSGKLDRQLGGSLLQTNNREYVFNHTSEDASSYDQLWRRSIYVPVIRNHLYDMFHLFDYTNASVINGNRATSTIAPQALFLMNSEFVADAATGLADRLLKTEMSREDRLQRLFLIAYGRPPTAEETSAFTNFIAKFEASAAREVSDAGTDRRLWQEICQSVVSSSEFMYLR